MKNIIEKIEAEKLLLILDKEDFEYNNGLDKAIDILKSYEIIECKALRKKNTEYYYTYDSEHGWLLECNPDCNAYSRIEIAEPNAELIDVTILIPKP